MSIPKSVINTRQLHRPTAAVVVSRKAGFCGLDGVAEEKAAPRSIDNLRCFRLD